MATTVAISELLEKLRERDGQKITEKEFETALMKHFNGSHASQQIAQLWNKMCKEGANTIGQNEVCSFLLKEMQQRESQVKAHLSLPLSHQPAFTHMTNTKETVCGLLHLPNPPQYMTVSKDGCINVWSTRFHLQQTTSINNKSCQSLRKYAPGSVCITSCVMMCGRLAIATTGRQIIFYDILSFSCLYKLHKLPYVPLCMIYGSVKGEESGHLIWGDENGCVGILSFSQPKKSLFHSNNVTFSRVGEHTPLVTLRYQSVHRDWVSQVGWTGPAHCVISAAQSSSPSLLIQHIWAHRKQYAFRVRMGVSCFAYSNKLEIVTTGSIDHNVRIWTPFSPHQPVACLTSHTAGIVGVVIDELSNHIFSLAQDLSLCVWDITEHYLLQTISIKFPFTQRQPDFGPTPLYILPLPTPTLAICCNEYMARFPLSTTNAGGTRQDTGHNNPVCAVAYIPNMNQLVSGCEGGEIRVWDIASGRCCMKVDGCHGDQELTSLAVDIEGSRILTGSRNGVVKVWESLTGQCLQSLNTNGSTEVVSILHNSERQRFLVTGWNKDITVFKDKTHGLSPEPAWNGAIPHCDDIIAMDYCSPNYLATGSFDGLTIVWNTDTERVVSQFHSMMKMKHSTTTRHRQSSIFNTPSRPPSSRRLSSYHLKSASSSHLQHVPVDQLLFLKTRVISKGRGQGTLVTSEGGYAYFWDMFSSTDTFLSRLSLTSEESEIVLALATDELCHWLVAGDTAGHLSLFNIQHFCTNKHTMNGNEIDAEVRWKGHSSEILDVVWVGPEFMVSASADYSVKMWTINGQCVGCFGQLQSWNTSESTTFKELTQSIPPLEVDDQSQETKDVIITENKKPPDIQTNTLPDTPTDTVHDKSLGIGYQTCVKKRMEERLHRRAVFSDIKTSIFPSSTAQFSPFQTLHVMDIRDVQIPQDVSAALKH